MFDEGALGVPRRPANAGAQKKKKKKNAGRAVESAPRPVIVVPRGDENDRRRFALGSLRGPVGQL